MFPEDNYVASQTLSRLKFCQEIIKTINKDTSYKTKYMNQTQKLHVRKHMEGENLEIILK